jgi:hypothetical protein
MALVLLFNLGNQLVEEIPLAAGFGDFEDAIAQLVFEMVHLRASLHNSLGLGIGSQQRFITEEIALLGGG